MGLLSTTLTALSLLAPPALLAADDLAPGSMMTGPILGWVFDSDIAAVRPLIGLPGSALLDSSLQLDRLLRRAIPGPAQDYLLAMGEPSEPLWLIRGLPGRLAMMPIPDVWPLPERVALSPTGKTAALFLPDLGIIQILTGLPQAPRLATTFNLGAFVDRPGAMAVSDEGEHLLVVANEGAEVFLFGPSLPVQRLALVGQITALAFTPRTTEAFAADRMTNAIYRIISLPWLMITPLAGEDEGVSAPVALEVSLDARQLIVANSDPPGILVLDMAGGRPMRVACPCRPTGLHRLRGNAVFRLTEPASGPVWLFDGDSAEPRTVFVPRPFDEPTAADPGEATP